jgi:hypothetical protein
MPNRYRQLVLKKLLLEGKGIFRWQICERRPIRTAKKQVYTADLAFVGFVVIITAIPVLLTLTQIYLQNPR